MGKHKKIPDTTPLRKYEKNTHRQFGTVENKKCSHSHKKLKFFHQGSLFPRKFAFPFHSIPPETTVFLLGRDDQLSVACIVLSALRSLQF